jgi:GTPase involved in cell partitioning and DNA repair
MVDGRYQTSFGRNVKYRLTSSCKDLIFVLDIKPVNQMKNMPTEFQAEAQEIFEEVKEFFFKLKDKAALLVQGEGDDDEADEAYWNAVGEFEEALSEFDIILDLEFEDAIDIAKMTDEDLIVETLTAQALSGNVTALGHLIRINQALTKSFTLRSLFDVDKKIVAEAIEDHEEARRRGQLHVDLCQKG